MVLASDLVHSGHLWLFLEEIWFAILMRNHPLGDILGNAFSCFIFHWFAVFSEQDGVHLGSETNEFLKEYSMGLVCHFSQHLFCFSYCTENVLLGTLKCQSGLLGNHDTDHVFTL